ncbi:MAG: aconitase X [Sphaerochaetaceae bacterium]|nr:aconitase X [Sphaerochaetaceae bacterium]MDD3163409.1 aconitase X [Sphaerochaetaceae bacterium]MDD4007600.1 aconitase X [Sphaerochaetaceae bacterium]MDD4397021.1 aconitase X [Sphaerochaetaceae bacterium]
MYESKMKLTPKQLGMLNGDQGEMMARVMETLVRFGDIFGATKMVKVTSRSGHLVTSFGIGLLKPLFRTMDQLIEAGVKVQGDFTVDPRPLDYANVKCNPLEKLVFNKFLYSQQERYEKQLAALGLRNSNAFTCACYLIGNVPNKGDILSWAESSAVVFANSVLGARCNRNSGMLDLFGCIAGYVPYFGLLTDEGRKAKWKVIVKTSSKPEAQVLGSAIGMKVMEDVPYVYGLDQYLGHDSTDIDAIGYLKDFGAATASNGAVGLYHIDGLTPEAIESKEALIREDAQEYVIDDAELKRVQDSYPLMWKKPDSKAQLCFIGCPHLTAKQLLDWTDRIEAGLKNNGRSKVTCQTVLTCPPDIADEFRKGSDYQRLLATGARLSSICPLMYTNNPLTKGKAIITSSNKLRTYSIARYYKDQEILEIITGGKA